PDVPSAYLHVLLFFFFNDPAPTQISPLSLHDALPICSGNCNQPARWSTCARVVMVASSAASIASQARAAHPSVRLASRLHAATRSEEHTSELQSLTNLVCRLLLEKKKRQSVRHHHRAA